MRTHTLSFILLALLAGTLTTGCADKAEGRLDGSVSSVYDLSFQDIRARLYSSELAIEFTRVNGEVPVRLILRSPEGGLQAREYNLATEGDITGRSRGTEIPRVKSGSLRLEKFDARSGAIVEGDFEAILVSGGDRLTLTGEFKTTLEITNQGYPDLREREPVDMGPIDMRRPRPRDLGPIPQPPDMPPPTPDMPPSDMSSPDMSG